MRGKFIPVFFIGILLTVISFFSVKDLVWAASWPENINFPRVQSRHQWGYSRVFDFDPIRFSKYDHVGFSTVPLDNNNQVLVNFTQELKNQNPNLRTRIYSNPNTTLEEQTYPGHFLFYPGSKLAQNIGQEETTITVKSGANFKPGYDGMFWDFTGQNDAEHVKITAVNGNQLTVIRGYKGTSSNPNFSLKRNHNANTYLSVHVSKGQNNSEWYPNWAILCKNGSERECGTTYKNYVDYKVPLWITAVKASKTDGLKIDNAFGPWIKDDNYDKEHVDIDNDGDSDGLAVSRIWGEGLLEMYKKLRHGLPDFLIHGNGASPNPYLNGKLYQGWNGNALNVNWSRTMSEYLAEMTTSREPQFVLADSEVYPNHYKEVRLGLAATLMGDGFYGNKGEIGGVAHGPDTWYDEYDNGAGSSLISDVEKDQNFLDLYPGTGNKFNIGDEIYLPEENLKITDIQNDRIFVERAYVSDYLNSLRQKLGENKKAETVPHQKGEKVYTIDQIRKGKGFLGKPLSKQNANCTPNSVDSCIRYFTNGVVLVNPSSSSHTFPLNGTYYRINGTQDRNINNGKKVTSSVTLPGKDGLILIKKPNLTPSPTSTIQKPGDANGDNIVDGVDYVIWLNHYNQNTSNGQSYGDFNKDTKVDGLDYVIWVNNAE